VVSVVASVLLTVLVNLLLRYQFVDWFAFSAAARPSPLTLINQTILFRLEPSGSTMRLA
jgi:hypothetical protein